MKNVIVFALLSIVLISACAQQDNISSLLPAGKLQVSFSDSIQKLAGLGKATSVVVTVKEISVHKASSDSWITISNTSKTLDLIEYSNNTLALLGEGNIEAGRYTQIRLLLDNESSIKIYYFDLNILNRTYSLKVPSNEIKLVNNFEITSGQTTNLILDFDIPSSITREGGDYTFRPTIKITEEKKECDRCTRV